MVKVLRLGVQQSQLDNIYEGILSKKEIYITILVSKSSRKFIVNKENKKVTYLRNKRYVCHSIIEYFYPWYI